jgi:hypothetical protein
VVQHGHALTMGEFEVLRFAGWKNLHTPG